MGTFLAVLLIKSQAREKVAARNFHKTKLRNNELLIKIVELILKSYMNMIMKLKFSCEIVRKLKF